MDKARHVSDILPSKPIKTGMLSTSKQMIIGTNILIMPIFHAKALRNRPKLTESQSLIEMSCMNVRRNHSVKLQNSKAYPLGLFKGILMSKNYPLRVQF